MSPAEKPMNLARVSQALHFLNVSRTKLYDLMRDGELPFVKLGKTRRIAWEELFRLVERHTRTGL